MRARLYNFVYFEKGKCIWSDKDNSRWDKTPYYPAPEGVEVGTRCKIVDGVAVADPIPEEELNAIFAQEQWSEMFSQKMYELKNECNKSIQTIPADIRTSVLERIKTRPKYYNETWQHFYQRCQNICHDQFELFYPEARKAARWVMERIEKHVILKKNLEEQMKNMTFDDLKSFDCSQHWEGVKNEKGNVIKNYAS